MSDLEKKDPTDKCNGRKRDGSGYCQHEAGWGTDHPGYGRCKFHGGSSPNGEKAVINSLKDAAEDAAVAYKLRLKHVRKKIESGDYDDVDWTELDRLARTAFDRTGHGATSKQELENTGDEPLSETEVIIGGSNDPDESTD